MIKQILGISRNAYKRISDDLKNCHWLAREYQEYDGLYDVEFDDCVTMRVVGNRVYIDIEKNSTYLNANEFEEVKII